MKRWLNKFFSVPLNPRPWLALILTVSVLLRGAAAIGLGDTVDELPGTFDQISYHNLALRVLGGYGFSFGETWWPITPAGEPTAHWSYLYTLYLVLVYALFGPHPVVARLIQALVVGILHPWLAYQIGQRVFSTRVGLWAAFITAIYAYFIYYAAALMTEPFYITAILGGFFLALEFLGDQKKAHEVVFGLQWGGVLGIAILLRQLYLLFVPFFFLWVGWVFYRKNQRIPALSIAAAGVVIFLMILPFTIYNYLRFERFVLLNTNSGYAFFWGNHPIYGNRFVPILTPEMGSYQDLIPPEVRHLDEAALDQELLRRGFQFVLEDPGRYILLSLSRIPAYFIFWPSRDSGLISNLARLASWGLFLPFIIFGLARSAIKGASVQRKSSLSCLESPEALLIGFALFYSGVHLLTWALIRYRLPVDAVLILYAASGLAYLSERLYQPAASTKQVNFEKI